MKKLMIAAAAAAVGLTSFGELCEEDTAADACAVYNIKFTFKTLAGKQQSCAQLTWLIDDDFDAVWARTDIANVTITDTTTAAGGAHDQTVFPRVRARKRALWWADNVTRTFDGILWQCRAACFEGRAFWAPALRNGLVPGRINYALWETRSKRAISFPVLRYYTRLDRSKYSWWTRNARDQFRFLGRYGQKAQKVAAYWTPSVMRGFIAAAGFGTFDANNKRVTALSGNAVGMIAPLNTGAKDACGRDSQFFLQIGFMCEDFYQWCCDGCYVGVETVPASGTWSLRYNASLSRGTKSLAKILPEYMVFGPAAGFGSAGFTRIRNFLNANLWNVVVDANGIFYAPRYLTAFMLDDEGNPIEWESSAAGEEDKEATYLNDLAVRAEKAMALEIFADLDDAGEYVQNQLWFTGYSKENGKVAYKVDGADEDIAPAEDGDNKGKYDFSGQTGTYNLDLAEGDFWDSTYTEVLYPDDEGSCKETGYPDESEEEEEEP